MFTMYVSAPEFPALQILFVGLIVLFIISQSIYFINNLLVDLMVYPASRTIVEEVDSIDVHPSIHILLPLYREPRSVLEQTLEGLARLEYPTEKLHLYLITEADDDVVHAYLETFIADAAWSGITIEHHTVRQSTIASYVEEGSWELSGDAVPRTKASALKYAFRTLSLPAEDVVTVFDADTIVPADTFRLAVSGLDTYDVVQAKQTVRNHGSGWLPRLEAMGIAAWCHVLYGRTTRGPYQLLGKAYFFRVEDLWSISDWRIDAITEDLTLGLDAYQAGYSLGIVDRYIQDICPSNFSDWVSQKRRWVAGPYPYLRGQDFDARELFRFWTYGISNQVVALVNIVGVPAGILYFLFWLAGFDLYYSPVLVVVLAVNFLNWCYYSAETYRATVDAIEFTSTKERALFYLSSNPITQLVYSMLWAIPVTLAIWDYLWSSAPDEFHVTPKDVEAIGQQPEK